MNLLLDTHVLLWAAARGDRLPPAARGMIEEAGNTLWFFVASLWEVASKRTLDRPDFRADPGVLRVRLLSAGYRELGVEGRYVLAHAALPALHGDPFDRILLAHRRWPRA